MKKCLLVIMFISTSVYAGWNTPFSTILHKDEVIDRVIQDGGLVDNCRVSIDSSSGIDYLYIEDIEQDVVILADLGSLSYSHTITSRRDQVAVSAEIFLKSSSRVPKSAIFRLLTKDKKIIGMQYGITKEGISGNNFISRSFDALVSCGDTSDMIFFQKGDSFNSLY